MIRVVKEPTRLIVKGVRKDPIGRDVGVRIASPLDVVEDLTFATKMIAFESISRSKVLQLPVDDERWRWRLFGPGSSWET